MTFKKFEKKDLLYNILETNPRVKIDVYDSKLHYNDRTVTSGAFSADERNVPSGFVSLYEMNIDRNAAATGLILPLFTKTSDLDRFTSISAATFDGMEYGATLTGSYPLSASISRHVFTSSLDSRFGALRNTLDYYSYWSKTFTSVSNYNGTGSLISIPSIFYGSSIKKGTVDLKFYVSGTLVGELQDTKQNGELVQVGPSGSAETISGSVGGVILYNEGFILLTGSWALATPFTADYNNDGIPVPPSWIYYGVGANDGHPAGLIPSSSYSLLFQGRNYVPNLTMFAHAEKGEMNHSNNPTCVEFGQAKSYVSGAYVFEEPAKLAITNVVQTPYPDPTGSFQKTTYISKIGIYDKDKNLIAIASVAKPVKKTTERNLTFKLKVDI